MTKRAAGIVLATAMLAGLASTGRERVRAAAAEVRLSVPGAANAMPSIAALGRTVAIAWAATRNGSTDVFVATSSDGGATFSSPHRVNDQPGDANFNGDQATRVTLSGTQAAPVMTVIWPAKKSAI